MPRFTATILAGLTAALAWYWTTLPLGTKEVQLISLHSSPIRILTLAPGDEVVQGYQVTQPLLSAFSFYFMNDQLANQSFTLTITDQLGNYLASSSSPRISYENERLKLTFPVQWIDTNAHPKLLLKLRLNSGSPLGLIALSENPHSLGQLSHNQLAYPDLDTALAAGQPTFPSAGQKNGITAGIITLAGALAVYFIPHRYRRLRYVGVGLTLIIVTPLALGGFLENPELLGINDWDLYFSIHESLRHSLLDLNAFPFWNPYTCGGTAGLGDPEFPIFTLTFLLEIIFGVPLGLRLAIFLSTATGAIGLLALGKRLGLSPLAALAASLVGFFGSVNLLEIVEGHPNIFSAMWIPWIFWSYLAAYQQPKSRWPIVCGIFLALTFYQGGIYLLFYTSAAFLIIILLAPRPRDALIAIVKSGLWALGFAALKLVPSLLWLRQFQDEAYASSTLTWPYLHEILLGRHLHGAEILPRQGTGWHEYGAYIGPLALALALLGLTNFRRSHLTRSLCLAIFLAIGVSSAGPALEPIFDQLPFIPRSSISRVILFAIIPLAILAGRGLDQLRHWRAGALQPAIVGLLAVVLMSLAYPLSQQAFIVPLPAEPITPAPPPIAFTLNTHEKRINGIDYTRTYPATLAGYGPLNYCTPLSPPPRVVAVEQGEDSSIVTLGNSRGNRVELISWSPNLIRTQAEITESTEVIINTNYARGWTVNGQAAREVSGRLGVLVEPGHHDLTFRYRSPGFVTGLIITLATVLAALYLLLVKRK